MGRKSKSPTRNRAPDLRIRRSDVLQLSCREFYVEPAELLLRSSVTRDLDTLDPLVNALQTANQTQREMNNSVTNK